MVCLTIELAHRDRVEHLLVTKFDEKGQGVKGRESLPLRDGGDGNLTETTLHVDATTTRVTQFGYDWRDADLANIADTFSSPPCRVARRRFRTNPAILPGRSRSH